MWLKPLSRRLWTGWRRVDADARETNRYVAIQVVILADQTEASFAQVSIANADAFAREWLSLAARTHMDAQVTRAAQSISIVSRGR